MTARATRPKIGSQEGSQMEIEDKGYMRTGGHECGRDVKLWKGDTYEHDQRTPHVCDPDYVTDYWRVTNEAGTTLHMVFGTCDLHARSNALRSLTVRKSRDREGGFYLKRMTSKEYIEYTRTENDS